jgi:autotransporter-associated beta strand protein
MFVPIGLTDSFPKIAPMHLQNKRIARSLSASAFLLLVAQLPAGEIIKANNTTALNATGAWAGSVVPTSGDIAVWDSTTTADRSNALGGNVSFGGIKVTNVAGGTTQTITTTTGAVLTLGSSGIDMSAATVNLTISAIMDLSASQTWNVASGRTLTIGAQNTGSGTITLSGAGATFALATSSNGSSTTTSTTGPFGIGTVNLENGIRLTSSSVTSTRTIRNAVNLNGDIEVLMGNSAANSTGIIFSGGLNVGSATRTITVTNASSALNTASLNFGGNGGSTTVSGSGRLVLENGNTSDSPMVFVRTGSGVTSDFAVFDADLTIGNGVTLIAAVSNSLTANSDLIINSGGALNTSSTGNSVSSLTIGSLSGGGTAFNGTSNAAAVAPTLTIDGGSRTIRTVFSGVLQSGSIGTFNVTKLGNTTQVFSGDNTYTGKTTVSGGGLFINGTHLESAVVSSNSTNGYSGTNVGHFQVGTGATFGGSGRIAGFNATTNANMVLVQSGGILAPGGDTALGTLVLDGANISGTGARVLNMASGSKFDFTLAGNGSSSDQLAFWNFASGDLLLNSNAIDLSLSGARASGTYTVSLFQFYSDAGLSVVSSGLTTGLTIGTLGDGIDSASLTFNESSIDLTYTVTAVPEPSTAAALAGLVVLCSATIRRRRTKRN